MTRLAALVLLLAGCDVERSLGAHDAATRPDAIAADVGRDAIFPNDAGIDAARDTGTDAEIPADVGPDSPPICAVPDAGTCTQCEAAMCCAQYLACDAAATCPCIVDCVLAGHGPASCVTHCGADHGESDALVACARHHCTCP